MNNYINTSIYKSLLEKFFQIAAPLYRCGYPYGPFIPYAMPHYKTAPIKIFYIGRDTYYWTSKEKLFDCMRNSQPEEYLKINSDVLNTTDILNKYNNNSGSFWNFVAKLHLLIRTGIYFNDINSLGQEEQQIIEEIGYGNLNGIELKQSLENEGTWQEITSITDYQKLKEAGQVFEKVSTLLKAYHPDFIIILNWEERDDIFDGLNVHWKKEYYKDGLQAIYTINDYPTKIIWAPHPRRFSFLGTNPQKMAELLSQTFRLLQRTDYRI